MEKYIALIMFITPGFVARYIIDKIIDKDEIKSEFEKTVISLFYGIPIFFITLLFMTFEDKISGFKELKTYACDFRFIIKYSIITVVAIFIFSAIVLIYQLKLSKLIKRRIRGLFKLQEISDNENGWKEFFDQENKSRIIGVYKGTEEIAIGALKNNTINNSKRSEIILSKETLTKELKDYLTVEKVYINLDKDIVLKEYRIENGGDDMND